MGECRDVGEGIVQGDFKKVTFNAGVLGLYVLPTAGAARATKFKVDSCTSLVKVGAVSGAIMSLVNWAAKSTVGWSSAC